MIFDEDARTIVVFSHPNHELAVFGFLQKVRPWIVYLTDGGGEDRVEQTRQGLRRIGLLENARFLDCTEKSFYDALLDQDSRFYAGVASRLREIFQELKPAQVLCDAVEFYNPVHDMSLPLVRRALQGVQGVEVFEIPLVYQRPEASESYEVQRPVGGDQVRFPIEPSHVDQKQRARDEVYTILTAQLPMITAIPREHLATEVIVKASEAVPVPDQTKVLRYEWRAKLLLERGEIDRMITWSGHYVPVISTLLASPAAATTGR